MSAITHQEDLDDISEAESALEDFEKSEEESISLDDMKKALDSGD